MRTGFGICPGARMQTGFQSNSQERVPGRMKFDLVEAMAVAIESPQLRRELVGIEPELNGFRPAQRATQRVEFSAGPRCTLPLHRLTQNDIAREQIIGLKRRGLVPHLEHRGRVSRQRTLALYQSNQGNSATCSNPIVSGHPMTRFMFWMAWPEAPFTKLSSAEMTIARPGMRSLATPMKVMFEPRTWRVWGVSPNGST